MTNGAIVIGGGVNGLVAATYLAKAGRRVTLVEASGALGGLCRTAPMANGISAPAYAHSFHALDPQAIRDLKLPRHGLRFAVRDMPLVGLRTDGKHVVAGRDAHVTARNLAVHSASDAQAWPRFRRDLFQAARVMRRLWWDADRRGLPAKPLSRLRRSTANAWLDVNFESEALKSLLMFDASDGGLSPLDAGSPLLLLWRAAQEMCGLQGAVAMTVGGPGGLVAALESAARASGVCIRTDARVRNLSVQNGKVRGVELESGVSIEGGLVLSSLSRTATLDQLVRPGDAGFSRNDGAPVAPKIGVAKVLLAFDRPLPFGGNDMPQGARFVIADRPESLVAAHEAARAGKLPDELVFEFVLSTASDPDMALGKQVLSALIRPVPFTPAEGWAAMKALLAAKVLAALERFSPGASKHAIAAKIFTPDEMAQQGGAEINARRRPSRMLLDWRERAQTPIGGLWLCGADTDAMGAVSGRAARIAARLALQKAYRT